jgi:hypothetical protein
MTDEEIITLFPLENPGISCGLRVDLPKKERRHIPVLLGLDVRNKGDKGFIERDIFACERCGKDFNKPPGYTYPTGPCKQN